MYYLCSAAHFDCKSTKLLIKCTLIYAPCHVLAIHSTFKIRLKRKWYPTFRLNVVLLNRQFLRGYMTQTYFVYCRNNTFENTTIIGIAYLNSMCSNRLSASLISVSKYVTNDQRLQML